MKKYFVTGLLIWIPLVITFVVLAWIINTLDQILLLVPANVRPEAFLGFHVPGIGVLVSLLLILLTGLAAANFVGQRMVRFWEGVLSRIPVVKSIYYSVKQVSDGLGGGDGGARHGDGGNAEADQDVADHVRACRSEDVARMKSVEHLAPSVSRSSLPPPSWKTLAFPEGFLRIGRFRLAGRTPERPASPPPPPSAAAAGPSRRRPRGMRRPARGG